MWIDEEITTPQIAALYSRLADAIQNNANGSPQAYSQQRDELIEILRNVNVFRLSQAQREFVEKLQLWQHVGAVGVAELEGNLYKNSLDVATAAENVRKIASDIQSAVDRSNQIRGSLKGLVEIARDPSDQILIRVVFDGAASIDDLVGLKKWTAEWHDIGRGLAMAVGAAPEDIRVVGANKGSLVIVLATVYGIAQVVATVLLKSLEVAEKVLNLQKMGQEVKNLGLTNTKLEKEILASTEAERKAGIEAISRDVTVELSVTRQLDGEQQSTLENSVKKLISFIEKGGQVDLVLPVESKDEGKAEELSSDGQKIRRLRDDVQRIRAIESEMKMLDHDSEKDS